MAVSIYMKWPWIDGEFLDFDALGGRTSESRQIAWTALPGLDSLVREVRRSHPKGVDSIRIGVKRVPGFNLAMAPNGIIAILIGLLLPAVQSAHAQGSAERRLLGGILAPGGSLGFLLGDGSVRSSSYVAEYVLISS